MILLSPLLLTAAIIMWLSSAAPVIFMQHWNGCKCGHFAMSKLHSIAADAEAQLAGLGPSTAPRAIR